VASSRIPFVATASLLALTVAGPAAAQNFYVGAAVEFGDTEMSDAVGGDYSGELTMGSVIAGVRFTTASNFFFGAEGETSLFTDYETDTFTGDDVDRISRLRAIGGYTFDRWSVYAAAGGAWLEGLPGGAGLEDSADGYTYGLGGEYSLNDRFNLRVEAIRDDLEFEDGSYGWENTALRAGAIVKF